ncbi:MAG: TetR/AcrR family transcriptional regulator [Pseudomonadota bacterium]
METPRDLKSACIAEAIRIVEEVGLEKLSLREVARRLGVSHQAPYKHFSSRDHILSEVVSKVFADFARYLDDRPRSDDPWIDMRSCGLRYFEYAAEQPLQYRLMFSSVLPPSKDFPSMVHRARHAFALLKDCIAALPRGPRNEDEIEQDALFVWSTIHGLVGVMNSDVFHTLNLSVSDQTAMIENTLDRVGSSLASR